MRRSDLYLSTIIILIGVFLFGAHYLRFQHEVVLEQDGYQLIQVAQSQTIWPHKEPIVFIIESTNNKKEIYKFDGYEHDDFGTINYSYYQPNIPYEDNDYYFINGFQNDLPFQRKLEDLTFEDRYDIVHSGTTFEARQLIQHNLEPGIMGYIDTMPLIFLVLGLFAFIIFKIIDLISYVLVKALKSKTTTLVFHSALIVFLIYFLTLVRLTPWFPTSVSALLIRNALVIVPTYALISYVKKNYSGKSDFWRNQFTYFLIILVGGNLLLWLGNRIGYAIDLTNFEKMSCKPFFCTYDSLAIGFLMACAVGLILRNIIDQLFAE